MRVFPAAVLAAAALFLVQAGAAVAACFSFDAATLARARSVGDAARGGVVVVQEEGAGATGWVVSSDGLIMTNQHVVAGGASGLSVWTLDGHLLAARVVATSAAPDVALLRVDALPPGVTPMQTGDSSGLKAGQALVAIGNPGGVGNWVVTLGAFLERAYKQPPGGVGPFDLESTVPGRPGSSGSPVLDLDGKVVGMAWGGRGGFSLGAAPIPADASIHTYDTPLAHALAVPIEDALAVRPAARATAAALRADAAAWSSQVKKPPKKPKPKPRPRPAPPPAPSPTPPPPEAPASAANCIPPQGEGFDAGTLGQGQALTDRVRASVVTVMVDGQGFGTGWLLSADGLVVTNHHVIADATGITVWLLDGRSFSARVVGSATQPDVAFLRFDAPSGLTALQTGSSTTLVADQALVAVGHPGEVGFWTASIGRFLRFGDSLGGGATQDLASTVPSLQGNSGSPILDLNGKVVGIIWGSTARTAGSLDRRPTVSPADPQTYITVHEDTLGVPIEDVLSLGRSLGLLGA